MARAHARLSPSSAERWISCPASVRATADEPDEESAYAREGTIAHEVAEVKVLGALGEMSPGEVDSALTRIYSENGLDLDTATDMSNHGDAHATLVLRRAAEVPFSQVLVEKRLDTGVPECWGTSDVVIVSPSHVEIIDYKYGQGVRVSPVGNPQLRLYALGALRTFGDLLGTTEEVVVTVHQPRLQHVESDVVSPETLRAWRDDVVEPAARVALYEDNPPFGPSDEACRWCPLSGRCRAQLEAVFADEPFEDEPDLLSPDEIAVALRRVPEIKTWLKGVEEAALTLAYREDRRIPGFKVVLSGGRRVISDPDAAVGRLVEIGYDPDEIAPRKVLGIGALEKTLGESFSEVEPYVSRTEGRPSLVDESDRRPEINQTGEAALDFAPTEKDNS